MFGIFGGVIALNAPCTNKHVPCIKKRKKANMNATHIWRAGATEILNVAQNWELRTIQGYVRQRRLEIDK